MTANWMVMKNDEVPVNYYIQAGINFRTFETAVEIEDEFFRNLVPIVASLLETE